MIKVGIVGIDAVAQMHTGILLTNNHYEIAGCYAPDNRESMVFARQFRLVSYSSLEALFKYTDAIDIAGSFPEMMTLAEKSLKAMKHVYIAQPHHLSLSEVQHLVKLANESGVVLQLGAGYRYCPVYEELAEIKQQPRFVEIKHQIRRRNDEDLLIQLNTELTNDLDMVTGILHTSVRKMDIKSWAKPEGGPDLLNCRLECENGCSVNMLVQILTEGESKLDVVFNYSDLVINADVFKSVVEKHYFDFDVVDSIVLDAYNEKMMHKQDLTNFYLATCNRPEAIRRIEEQLHCITAADFMVEHIKQTQPVTSY